MLDLPLADPGLPRVSSPQAFLWWLARRQKGILSAAVVCGMVGYVAGALVPWQLGAVVDDGLEHGLGRELAIGIGLLAAVGLVQVVTNVVGHRLDVANWMRAAFATTQLVGHHVTRTGDAITDELPTGEVVSTVANDAWRIGDVYLIAARFLGAIVSFVAVAVLLLQVSVPLGLLVLLGVPVVVAALSLLVKPLQTRQATQRESAGRLVTLGSDTVSGLRILRGIGGEDVFSARYRAQSQRVRDDGVAVARVQATLDALQTFLPGIFVTALVWAGARMTIAGDLTPGQLVAFYGVAAFLVDPLWVAIEAMRQIVRGMVGARKVIDVLAVPRTEATATPATSDARVPSPAPGDLTAELVDPVSGVRIRPGRLVALVSVDPDESAEIALRLGRLVPGEPLTGNAARWGRARLDALDLHEVRERVVVAEATAHLFSGSLRDELDVRDRAKESDLLAALEVADASDLVRSHELGLDGEIEEKGRNLSGGQRQRLALARALLTDAEVLILVEPTSAVDAHTEARVAARLASARQGRTTVVVTASPLVLEHVDEVVVLVDGRVRAAGTHHELLGRAGAEADAYRAIVSRTTGTDPLGPSARAAVTTEVLP